MSIDNNGHKDNTKSKDKDLYWATKAKTFSTIPSFVE